MPIIGPVVGSVIGAIARSAAGPILARGATGIAGRAVSAAQLAKAAKVARGAARATASTSRIASFVKSTGAAVPMALGQSVEMEANPLPTLKSPTMAGEVTNG